MKVTQFTQTQARIDCQQDQIDQPSDITIAGISLSAFKLEVGIDYQHIKKLRQSAGLIPQFIASEGLT